MIGRTILQWLGAEAATSEPGVLDRIATRLEAMPQERARYVAAFAYLLARVAGADSHVSADEIDLMHRLVQREADLSDEEAKAVVDLALGDLVTFSGTHNLDVAREFIAVTTFEQRVAILRCLFAVSAADDSVGTNEDNEIRRISRELKIEHADFIRARAEVKDRLAVLRSGLAQGD